MSEAGWGYLWSGLWIELQKTYWRVSGEIVGEMARGG